MFESLHILLIITGYYFFFADCEPGEYGASCEETCGECTNDSSCDIFTGVCVQGCKSGYYPPYCKESK